MRRALFIFFAAIKLSGVFSQDDSATGYRSTLLFAERAKPAFFYAEPVNYPLRRAILASSAGALTAGSLIYLNQAWYKDYNTGKFHFFNDNPEWLQMDKMGHMFTTYQTGRMMMDAFKWAGSNRAQQLFIGGTSGLIYMTAIECMDGFSDGWGFSWGDELADILGASAAISQEAFWHKQRIQVKFSYAQSGLAKFNPELLGKNLYTQVLKDYNGQTYWLSANISSFLKKETKFPKWLNVAVGYSAYGMLAGRYNSFIVQDDQGNVLRFERERRFYLSLDVDLTRIKTRSKFLKSLFSAVNILKFPAPALQLNPKGIKGYWIYY
jgi:hypothetical protein